MSLPAFFPPPRYVQGEALSNVPGVQWFTLAELCHRAEAPLRASGDWTLRRVGVLVQAQPGRSPIVEASPGYLGAVLVRVPPAYAKSATRYALGAMAYSIFDGVARESIRGLAWAGLERKPGRAPSRRALTSAERVRRHRARRKATGDSANAA